jgi:hypothetical protein
MQSWLQILHDVLYMDEVQFTLDNINNKTNCYPWVQQNPQEET